MIEKSWVCKCVRTHGWQLCPGMQEWVGPLKKKSNVSCLCDVNETRVPCGRSRKKSIKKTKQYEIKMKNVYCTRCSQAVTHPSTIRARRCLTSVIGREPVFSTWYGRRQSLAANLSYIYTRSNGQGKLRWNSILAFSVGLHNFLFGCIFTGMASGTCHTSEHCF